MGIKLKFYVLKRGVSNKINIILLNMLFFPSSQKPLIFTLTQQTTKYKGSKYLIVLLLKLTKTRNIFTL